jgi:hypothetical protein
MTYACIKAGAAVLVLGGFAIATPALAVSPLPFAADSVVILVQDEENQELWHDLRPDVTPPEAAVGDDDPLAPKEEMKERPKEEGSGNAEEKALEEDGLIPE